MAIDFISSLTVSLQSLGTYLTLLASGFLLKKWGKLSDALSKDLATISLNVTIPCLLFASVLNCEQNFSTIACADLISIMKTAWILLLWPMVVVGCGLALARLVVIPFGRVPTNFRKTAMVAVGFGNSTGMPVTLLTAIHTSYAPDTPLGAVDPTMFLAIYLLLYPVLQWSLGGYLMGIYNKQPRPAAAEHIEMQPAQGNAATEHTEMQSAQGSAGSRDPAQLEQKANDTAEDVTDDDIPLVSPLAPATPDVASESVKLEAVSVPAPAPAVREEESKSLVKILQQQLMQPPVRMGRMYTCMQ